MAPFAADTPQPDDPAPTSSDDRLLSFLRLKLAGEALPAAAGALFHDCDIYAADPATLTAGYLPAPARKGEGYSWFFFTFVRPKSSTDSRKKRMVGGGAGTWHSERAPRAVHDGEGNCVGHTQYFSYKRKTGKSCSERTDWYMVEFTDGQEGDHDRIHGGEPVLVLCKIYKAHSGSRSSSSSSRSARKRKATEEHADPSSAPLKAKRRLFSSSAPTQLPASQEQVSSRVTMVTSRLELQGEAAKVEPEAYHGEIDDHALDDFLLFMKSEFQTDSTSDYFNFSTNPEASQEQVSSRVTMATSGLELQSEAAKVEPEAYHGETDDDTVDDLLLYWESQCKTNSTSDYQNFSPNPEASASQSKTSTTHPSSLMSETEMSQAKIGDTSDYLRFWPEPEASQGMSNSTSDYLKFSPEAEATENMTNTAPPSLVMSEPGMTAQGKIGGTSDNLRLWSDLEAFQGMINSPSPSLLTSEPWMTLSFGSEPEVSQGMIHSTSEYLNFSPKTEALQKTRTTPRSLLMFEPEVQAPQGESETSALDWGIQMAGVGTTPVLVHCNDNSTAASCSCSLGWLVGAPPKYDMWSTTGFPSSPSMFGGPALWSC
ncbi:hypothetical protein SEVIR_9G293400v4 [Setaria viridis]|uniref:NAC domain-containing protein n=1 Tax=Setaria viridis TaxID=4556 RepID=A0A4U6TBI1_SETVI|nr:hypothetical protein SEVIR_9G293400v2 [Setaria viridis]